MASIKERLVIAHLRHIAGHQHPLVHQRKRGNLHGKQFPTRFISAGDLRGQPRLVVSMPTRRRRRLDHPHLSPTENLEKGLSKVNCSAMDGSNC